MVGDDADPFLIAADEGAMDEHTVSMCSPTDQQHLTLTVTPTRKVGRPKGSTKKAEPKKGATENEQPSKKRPRGTAERVKQSLSTLELESDVELMHTIFLEPSAKKGAKPAKGNKVPITLWPQYRLSGVDGTFLLVSASELWLEKMITFLRCKGEENKTLKRATTNVMYQIKRLWKTLLGASFNCDDTEDVDEDDLKQGCKRRTWSGFHFTDVVLLQKSWGTTKPTLVNTGVVMVLLLDAEGIKFIREVIVGMIEQISLEAPDSRIENETTPGATWSFENDTPNIRGKVVWDPNWDSWKLCHKNKDPTFVDYLGKPLTVLHGPGDDDVAYKKKKAEAYHRAITSWNYARRSLPKSKQHLIPEVTLSFPKPATSTPDVIACSSHDPPTQTTDEALSFSLLSSDDSPAQESNTDPFV